MASSSTGPTDPSRRRGKFRDLVNACHARLEAAGLRVALGEVEQLLARQISMVAAQTGITEQTALKTYFDPSWAQSTTDRLVADAAAGIELDAHKAGPEQRGELTTGELLAVIAALGQAQLYAALNSALRPPTRFDTGPDTPRPDTDADTEPIPRPPRAGIRRPGVGYDPTAAAEATTILAAALAADPSAAVVAVELDTLRAAHRVLVAFVERLDDARWLLCHCCPPEEQAQAVSELRARVLLDAAHLERSVQRAAAAATAPMGKVLPLRRPKHRRTPAPPD